MSKITSESNGKKPFYKKWWVWVLVVILFFGVIGNLGDNDTDNNAIATDEQKDKTDVEDIDQEDIDQEDTLDKDDLDKDDAGKEDTDKEDTDKEDVDKDDKDPDVSNTSNQDDTDAEEAKESNNITMGQKNALKKAKSYLNFSAFSYNGLIDQLEYEGFSTEEATYGADQSGADWKEQAAKKAESYLDISSFSRDGLIDQLEYEGFTAEEAEYGVSAVGY